MNVFQRRRLHKLMKHLLHDARHVRHLRGDIAPSGEIESLRNAEVALQDAWETGDEARIEEAMERVGERIATVYPPRPFAKARENIEILVVALAVAMGFRTYFVQPFKIPTGSMQPTLYGIYVDQQQGARWTDKFPMNLVSLILFGERYVEVRAAASGEMTTFYPTEEYNRFYIGGIEHRVRPDMMTHFKPGDYVTKGQVLASGRVRRGDHIFVDKVRYNFRRPQRGDIFVFNTNEIEYPAIRKNSFYIKRLAGLPGETVSIEFPELVVDGEPVKEPRAFRRIQEDPGYSGGYRPARPVAMQAYLKSSEDRITLGKGEYLPLGDNTLQSLDGRYFGAVKEQSIVGPAFMVYWPFTKRWGFVD